MREKNLCYSFTSDCSERIHRKRRALVFASPDMQTDLFCLLNKQGRLVEYVKLGVHWMLCEIVAKTRRGIRCLQWKWRRHTLIGPPLINRPAGDHHNYHEHCHAYQLHVLSLACQNEPNGISQSSGKVTPVPRRHTHTHRWRFVTTRRAALRLRSR